MVKKNKQKNKMDHVVWAGERYSFYDILYGGKCNQCEDGLEWEAAFDADGTTYHAHHCNRHYSFHTVVVQTDIEMEEE
jgi:hypothetical protein